jgi:hypothetical protein
MKFIEQIEFLRNRALIERQMGTNQCLAKNSAGYLRLERANQFDLCADALVRQEGEIISLKAELASYKNKDKNED